MLRFSKKVKGVEIEDSIMTVTEKEKAIIETPFKRSGLNFLWYVVLAFLIVISLRLVYLNILKNDYYSELSKGNRIRSIAIKAPRGKIMDKFGSVLVNNIPSIDAVIVPRDLPSEYESRRRISEGLAEILDLDKGDLEAMIESQSRKSMEPVLLKENISQDQMLILSEKMKEMPGIAVENTAIRNYESSVIFSHVIGYDGKITREELNKASGYSMTDYIGKYGLEKFYEKELKGRNGARQVEVDSLGNAKKELGKISPQAGKDLILNIDEGLQKKIYDSLSSVLEKSETKTAAAVAIDPRNGGVLAMASLPSFDNNLFAQGISNSDYQKLITDVNLPLLNRAVNGEYPPGSTLKPAVAAAALAEGVVNQDTIINGMGGMLQIGSFSFRDWKTHGPSDIRTAIAESNDIYFYTIGGGYGNIEGLGMSRMKKYENLFGFGNPTGIDLNGESSGFIPDEDWKQKKFNEKWYIGNSYHAAIGQGFITATPLQLANFTASLANGGTLFAPRLVNRIKDGEGKEEYAPPKIIRKDFIARDVIQIVREGMRKTVTDGTARSLSSLQVAVAGKTGTAQFGNEDKTHAWFISFAPYDNPEIAMAVLVEGGGEGHSSAVPVTKEVLDWYFNH